MKAFQSFQKSSKTVLSLQIQRFAGFFHFLHFVKIYNNAQSFYGRIVAHLYFLKCATEYHLNPYKYRG